jgi:mRNA interferase YafQ
MRTISRSTAFKRDYRKIKSTPRYRDIDALLASILDMLASDRPLPPHHRDHTLSGDWSGYRECHVRPDLLLIYDKPENDQLLLIRLGSHSDLFG